MLENRAAVVKKNLAAKSENSHDNICVKFLLAGFTFTKISDRERLPNTRMQHPYV